MVELQTRATVEVHNFCCEIPQFWELNPLPKIDLEAKKSATE